MTPDADRRTLLRDFEAWSRTPMLLLSLVWLVLLIVEFTTRESRLLTTIGTAIWIVFLVEFVVRLVLAERKLVFLRANWLTVLSLAVPALRLFRALRVLRFARAARGVRLVRLIGGANRGMNALRGAMKRRGLGYVAALTVAVIFLGAAGMQTFEATGPNAQAFASYGDSLWWTAMLMTTLGSEFWPRTAEGRVLAFLISLFAFAVFGYLTAAFASFFVGQDRSPEDADTQAVLKELRRLRAELARLRPGEPPQT
jgi:voltage-gated potassium channel